MNEPLAEDLFEKFLKHIYLVMERCSKRQRLLILKFVKQNRREFDIKMWNEGRPVSDIQKSKLIVPVKEMPK